jgi:hypothetical protein
MKKELNGKKEMSRQEVLFDKCRKFITRIPIMDSIVVVGEYKRLKNDVDTMLMTSRPDSAAITQYDSLLKNMYDAVRKEYPEEMEKIDARLNDLELESIRKRTMQRHPHWKTKMYRANAQREDKLNA